MRNPNSESPSVKEPKILIVDDHEPNLLAIEAVLEPLGHTLVRASSGTDALKKLADGGFALVLLDVQMPGIDGFDTARLMKSRTETESIPIIFITAMSRDAHHVFEGYSRGAVDYLLKPFEPAILRSKVSVFVDLCRKAQQLKAAERLLGEQERQLLEQRSEQRYRALADSMPLCMWAARPDGSVYYANRAWSDYSGVACEEPATVTHHKLVHPDDRPKVRAAWEDSAHDGDPFEIEFRLRRKLDGAYRWHLGRCVAERDDHGTVEGWIVTAVDIDDRKTAADLRARHLLLERAAREKAEAANGTKDEFLATLSHEIRTPLHAILGWVQLLRGGDLDAKAGEQALETIERNARSQGRLIDDLLDLSRIVSGKTRLSMSVVDLRSIVEAAVASLAPAAQADGIQFDLKLDALFPFTGDAARLQQVVWNLLSNAAKFARKQGRIEVRLSLVGSSIELQVRDDGKGIPRDFLPFVFDRFRQADVKGARGEGGLGLGLAIVSHLVTLHGGTVRAESEGLGKGATFTVSLPARRSSGRMRAAAPVAASNLPHLTGVSILVVDDDADAREFLRRVLAGCGATITAASSVREALQLVEAHMPDVIVSDIGMPGEDGYSLVQKVMEHAVRSGEKAPKALAVTAFAMAEDRARALKAGFDSHLAKPFDPPELARVVANLVRPLT